MDEQHDPARQNEKHEKHTARPAGPAVLGTRRLHPLDEISSRRTRITTWLHFPGARRNPSGRMGI